MFSIRRVGSDTPKITKGIHDSLEDHFVIQLNDEVDENNFYDNYIKTEFKTSPSTKQKHISKRVLNEQVNELCCKINLKGFSDDDKKLLDDIDKEVNLTIVNSNSFKESFDKLCQVMFSNVASFNKPIDAVRDELLKNEYINSLLIKPQQKGVIRGNLFNKAVTNEFKKHMKDCIILNEYKHKDFPEILDLYISYNGFELCIYNQIDLWNGGEQLNRCHKYLTMNDDRVLCVVCGCPNYGPKSKAYELIESHKSKIIWYSDIRLFCKYYFKLV